MNRWRQTLAMLASAASVLSSVGCHVTNDWTAAMHAGCPLCGRAEHGHAGPLAHHTRVRPDVADQPSPGQFQPVPTRPVFFPHAMASGTELMSPPVPDQAPPQITPPPVDDPQLSAAPPKSSKTVLVSRNEPTLAEPQASAEAATNMAKPTHQATWVASTTGAAQPANAKPVTKSTAAGDDGWRAQRSR